MNAYERIVEKHTELTGIIAKISEENRNPTDEEKARIAALRSEVDAIKSEWESDGRAAFLAGLNVKKSEPAGPMILKADQRMVDVVKGTYDADYDRLSLGRLLKGYILGDWAGADIEQKAMASSPTSAGGMLIPTPLSARVIDLARNTAAVMRAGAVTVPMDTATLKLAKVTTDVTAGWYNEAAALTASDMVLGSVTFTARKLAALVIVNNELLEDGQGVDAVIEQSIANAIALELDRVALVGSGSAPEPRGVQNTSNIQTVTSTGTPADFDKFLTAIYKLRTANYEPNAAICAARTAETLAKLKTGVTNEKTPLTAPADWQAISKYVSNQVPVNLGAGTNESLCFVGQWNQLAVAMRKQLMIEVSREGSYDVSGTHYSAFQKDQTLIRAILRADVQVFQPAAFCLMSGITA